MRLRLRTTLVITVVLALVLGFITMVERGARALGHARRHELNVIRIRDEVDTLLIEAEGYREIVADPTSREARMSRLTAQEARVRLDQAVARARELRVKSDEELESGRRWRTAAQNPWIIDSVPELRSTAAGR